ncbi:hypothetical protein RND81_04G071600 [Saponaria officinalis]|uniref:Uncharacterized protein n=1 Tax=Saponaria officinalis TaxID=3572 RepID=A0AAW1LJP2_SAPOF
MDKNAYIVQGIQRKLDQIVEDAPILFNHLNVVMAPTAVYDLLFREEPVLRFLRPLLFNNPCPLSPPILNHVVSNKMLATKQEELRQLTEEVVVLFERIMNVLNWRAVVDICCARGRIVILPEGQHQSLTILNVYFGHMEALGEEQLREEQLRELDSSPSSCDSYSR